MSHSAASDASPVRGGSWLRRRVHSVSSLFALLSALCVVALMVITTVDVLRRIATGRALPGGNEISELLMVGMVFLGLAYAQYRKEHVSVSVLTGRMPARSAAVLRAIGIVTVLVFLFWMMVASNGEALRSLASGEYRFGLLQVPMWPARIAIPIGVAWLIVETLIDLWDVVTNPEAVHAARSDRAGDVSESV